MMFSLVNAMVSLSQSSVGVSYRSPRIQHRKLNSFQIPRANNNYLDTINRVYAKIVSNENDGELRQTFFNKLDDVPSEVIRFIDLFGEDFYFENESTKLYMWKAAEFFAYADGFWPKLPVLKNFILIGGEDCKSKLLEVAGSLKEDPNYKKSGIEIINGIIRYLDPK